jgi:hypothetical protein
LRLLAHRRAAVLARGHLTRACAGVLAAMLAASSAAGQTLYSDATIEISGSGTGSSRNCKVLLLPAQSLGDGPRLMLLTDGPSRLSFGIENATQYEGVALVRSNTRTPLIGSTGVTAQQFLVSDVGKAIQSQRLFFVTARRVDSGRYVSSRYERIDFDAVQRRIEANCAFRFKQEAPPPPPQPAPVTPSPRVALWNSVAGSTWKVRGRAFVAIGYSGLLPSAEEAKAVAEQKCREAGGPTCKAVGAWNYGCVYITVGSNTRDAGWAAGDTTDDAMKRCRSMRFQCKPPIGGCVE